jgi:dTDP-4-dehydrorhamnose reductase
MRCLIVGASGQVGGQLAAACDAAGWPWRGTSYRHPRPGLVPLDVRDRMAVEGLVRWGRPEIVFLPAALANVDRAEALAAECFAVNVRGVVHVATAAQKAGARLVFFSTDHVFGDLGRARAEHEQPAPENAYARAKVVAERWVRALLPDRHLILRTSGVFGPERRGKNFVARVVRTLRAGELLRVPADQWGQPTFGPDLARAALELARRGRSGTWHVTGPQSMTRFTFARLVSEVFGLRRSLIVGLPTARLAQAAPRPRFVHLSRKQLLAEFEADPIRAAQAGLETLRADLSGPSRSAG